MLFYFWKYFTHLWRNGDLNYTHHQESMAIMYALGRKHVAYIKYTK